jgi:hypothetical protein
MERARAPCRDAWVDCERGVKRFLLFRGGPPGLEFSILELGILDLYVGRVLLVVAVHSCTGSEQSAHKRHPQLSVCILSGGSELNSKLIMRSLAKPLG